MNGSNYINEGVPLNSRGNIILQMGNPRDSSFERGNKTRGSAFKRGKFINLLIFDLM